MLASAFVENGAVQRDDTLQLSKVYLNSTTKDTVLYYTIPYSTLLCSTLLYSALLCSTLLYSTLLHRVPPQQSMA